MKKSAVSSRPIRFLVAAAAASLALTACSNSLSGEPAPGAGPETGQVTVDEALKAKLPEKIASAGKIVVGTDASYAPSEFLDSDGKTVVGFDVDVFNAVAATFGVTVEWQPSNFDTIITGVNSGKYDVGVSSFTVNDERTKVVNMVSYFNAGTQWAAAAGSGFNPDDACGKTVAVQTGTVQDTDDLPARQAKCGANKIKVLPFTGQDEATNAVVSGRAEAMLADSPVIAYAVKQSGGKLESAGEIYDAAPYGYVVPQDEKEFADAIAQALQKTKDDGAYAAALEKWGVQDGAIDDFAVKP